MWDGCRGCSVAILLFSSLVFSIPHTPIYPEFTVLVQPYCCIIVWNISYWFSVLVTISSFEHSCEELEVIWSEKVLCFLGSRGPFKIFSVTWFEEVWYSCLLSCHFIEVTSCIPFFFGKLLFSAQHEKFFFSFRKTHKYELHWIFHVGVPLQTIYWKQNSKRLTFTEQIVYNFIIVSETLLVQSWRQMEHFEVERYLLANIDLRVLNCRDKWLICHIICQNLNVFLLNDSFKRQN